MSPPVAASAASQAPVVIRIVLAVICLVPLVIGLVIIATIFGNFLVEGLAFSASDEVWMALFLGAAAIIVLLPAIVLGILLRFARWKAAPTASLALAVTVGGAGVLVSGMFQTMVMPGDSESYVLLMLVSMLGIVLGALPPFLHWWNGRET